MLALPTATGGGRGTGSGRAAGSGRATDPAVFGCSVFRILGGSERRMRVKGDRQRRPPPLNGAVQNRGGILVEVYTPRRRHSRKLGRPRPLRRPSRTFIHMINLENSHSRPGRLYRSAAGRILSRKPVNKRIDILSDSTGETAERVIRAAMLQFPHSGTEIRIQTRLRTKEAVRPILERAARDGALVVFTVVSPELREFIHACSYELKVEALDLIGSLIGKLAIYLDRAPINMPSSMLPLSDEYFRRIEAVEFTVKSDDGKEPRNFKKADIVLVGVSRTSKTPLSTLLAQRGLKIANLPLVMGVNPPPELDEAPQDRIVGLTIGLEPLVEIRKARLRQLGMSVDSAYGLKEQVKEEIDYAARIFAAHPQWPVIDVTGRAIEETAVIILESLKQRDEASRSARAALV